MRDSKDGVIYRYLSFLWVISKTTNLFNLLFQVRSLWVIGGCDANSMAKRSVGFLLDTKFQTSFNWTGNGGKHSFSKCFGELVHSKSYICLNLRVVQLEITGMIE